MIVFGDHMSNMVYLSPLIWVHEWDILFYYYEITTFIR